jgi:hypothetical protein
MARTKAGRDEVERRENVRSEAIGELKIINDALEFVELADDLSVNQTKITVAKQRAVLNMLIKQLQDVQMPKVKDIFKEELDTAAEVS